MQWEIKKNYNPVNIYFDIILCKILDFDSRSRQSNLDRSIVRYIKVCLTIFHEFVDCKLSLLTRHTHNSGLQYTASN